MAQAISQIRSSKSKFTFGRIVQYTIVFIVILFILSPLTLPKAAVAYKSNNQAPIETATVGRKQTQTMSPQDMVHELLRTHPHPDVRGEFYEMVRDEKIRIDWFEEANAAFSLVPIKYSALSGESEAEALAPTLFVNLRILEPELHAFAQLTFYHEFVHYEQWRDGRIPEKTFVLQPLKSKASLQNACTKKWHAEVDAYHQECAFAQKSNLLTQVDPRMKIHHICNSTDETFDDTLRKALMQGRVGSKCTTTWESM